MDAWQLIFQIRPGAPLATVEALGFMSIGFGGGVFALIAIAFMSEAFWMRLASGVLAAAVLCWAVWDLWGNWAALAVNLLLPAIFAMIFIPALRKFRDPF